ncbi:MAG: hypothetical protein RI907_2894 [Pseudomonadota bacterium]|jgi:hypothetical protein
MPERERRRQAALLALLRQAAAPQLADLPPEVASALSLRADAWPGVASHRAHAQAVCARALSSAYPTLAAALGEAAMATLAWALWLSCPPAKGDLGTWGEGLAALLEGGLRHTDRPADEQARWSALSASLADWPWLADTARLDWARHRAARAAARPLDAPSLAAMTDADPDAICLRLQPHVRVLASAWPLIAIWQAHQGPTETQAPALALALAEAEPGGPHAKGVVVWWDDGVRQAAVSAEDAAWMLALATPGLSLARALSAAPASFDLSAWLQLALKQGWLQGATPLA